MTNDKHRKRAARKAANANGISLAQQVREYREATKAMPPATVPAPIALQLARHLRATGFHLSEVRDLAARERLIPDTISAIGRRDGEPSGPYAVVDTVLEAIHGALTELWVWAEQTAHASGAIPVVPDLFDKDPAQDKARDILYPGIEDGWCARGGTMPGPGDEHQVAEKNTRSGVRYSLPGAVPTTTLSRHASNTSDAKTIVAGTPAQPVWDAGDDLSQYLSGWMDRPGDSPADLAAALEGLRDLARDLPDAVEQIGREVTRRVEGGRIAGVDTDSFTAASTEFDSHFRQQAEDGFGNRNPVGGALWAMRKALAGAAATLTPEYPEHRLAEKFDGQPPAVIREELGTENFVQRQIEKTSPGDHSRAGRLTAMVDFVHALELPAYDAKQHRAAVTATRRGGQLPTDQQGRIPKTVTKGFDHVEKTDAANDDTSEIPDPYNGHQATVVLQDTATGCWRSWIDVDVYVGPDMWNPIIDSEYFTGHRNETRLVLTVGDQAAELLRELPAPVGSVHEDGPEWNCLVCHDTDNYEPPTTLHQLEHRAHQIRAQVERRAGIAMGTGVEVMCEGQGGVLVAALVFNDHVPNSRVVGFEWRAGDGWTAVVKHVEDGAAGPVSDRVQGPPRLGIQHPEEALFVADTALNDWQGWNPARLAEEIHRAIRRYS